MNQDKHFQLLQQRAAGMRENPTSTERKLLEALEITKGLPKFYPQHVIYPHIVDFVCLEKMIIIEVDGASHDGNQASDDLRDHDLQKLGYTVMRFTNGEVALSLATVVDSIKFECSFRTTKQMSSPKSVVKKLAKRQMIVPLPRVVDEEPIRQNFKTRAGKVRIRKALASGEKVRVTCAICKNPIADADSRFRHKGTADKVEWVHKSCSE